MSFKRTLESIFRTIIARRWWIVLFYAAITGPAAFYALKVGHDNSLDRLIVESDPDAVATKAFEQVFGKGEYILLIAEADDPFRADVLARIDAIEKALRAIRRAVPSAGLPPEPVSGSMPAPDTGPPAPASQPPSPGRPSGSAEAPGSGSPSPATPASSPDGGPPSPYAAPLPPAASDEAPPVEPSSALDAYRQTRGGFTATPEEAEAFRRFVTGTALFREQGLFGEEFFAIPVILHNRDAADLRTLLALVDRTLAPFQADLPPLRALGKIGSPYVNAYLDAETGRASARFMPFFGLLLVGLNLALYRSLRALAAFVVTLGVAVALTLGYVGATGGVLTIVSPLVPMTILITCTATLVYIHSRFVDHPGTGSIEEHQIFALCNKFTACTASIFATAVGFAALAVSQIRPIRELGIWVAVGLVFTWIVVFTLFPSLQRILRTPTRQERRTAGDWIHRLAEHLPRFTYRWRWPLITGSLVLSGIGAVSIFGLPGLVAPMRLETDGVELIDHDSSLYKDTRRFEKLIAGLAVTEVWVRGEAASMVDPAVLRGLDAFQERLKKIPGVGAVAGPTTILRLLRYAGGEGDGFPDDRAGARKLASDLEVLLPTTPALRGFVDASLAQTHISVISRAIDYEAYRRLDAAIAEDWKRTAAQFPALAPLSIATVGVGPLQAKIGYHLVPTLVESFAITTLIIFCAFLLVFRSGPARLMAMIPSLFAILVMFAVMRVSGLALNVATILIASTVLGTSENDQIHFFYHFLEKRRNGSAEEGLKHTIRIAGRAIFFATIINAGGFLAFIFAELPPMRHFGMLTALAFVLSMIADFTALPAALWVIYRQKPDAREAPRSDHR